MPKRIVDIYSGRSNEISFLRETSGGRMRFGYGVGDLRWGVAETGIEVKPYSLGMLLPGSSHFYVELTPEASDYTGIEEVRTMALNESGLILFKDRIVKPRRFSRRDAVLDTDTIMVYSMRGAEFADTLLDVAENDGPMIWRKERPLYFTVTLSGFGMEGCPIDSDYSVMKMLHVLDDIPGGGADMRHSDSDPLKFLIEAWGTPEDYRECLLSELGKIFGSSNVTVEETGHPQEI